MFKYRKLEMIIKCNRYHKFGLIKIRLRQKIKNFTQLTHFWSNFNRQKIN